ncbi:TonB-dependent receptor [Flavobacterium lindanitolerans]|uniref:TonB-dependent receptor-like protein n=1 Tax=Flavobacterium lindanitolerans TaxID=428988 RepID=A0A497UVE7_9FLAO|nr:TonB-dependent receptor [Flavobacterium lindanitolerans]PKW21233.1 TonB-dependent receptor-like protein [Flavobacterium lindanitolerans]RLJ30129.1 TonB-dependent receptor-like protein [Flavobacterium lindanitolerans]
MNQKNQKTHVPLLILIFLIGSWAKAQDKVTISGTIVNSQNNETLIGVSIYIPELQSGTTTNEYGFFSLSIPKGDYTLQVSYMGFQTSEEKISLQQNLRKNISLESSTQNLEEIVITERKNIANIKKPEMSVNKLTIQEIKKMPAVMGETDILKSILQLPGVTNAGEGASGFNVRGGAADQNLILLDEALLYNSSHLFGFFSVFNSDAIKDLKLYKGGIPSRFGGRVSSVLDIYQKEGNSNEFHMNGGIGVISSRLLAEGPLEKGKGSFLVAGRSSYAHLFLKLTDNKNSAYFYDLNTKLSYKLNENNSLFLSGYFGRDVFDIGDQFNNVYGNAVLNLRWNHLYSEKLFSNLSMIYSDYYYGLKLDVAGLNWDSGIKNYNIKYDFKHYISDRYKMTYGLNAVYYDFNPGTVSPTGPSSGINREQLDKKYALEPALYVDAEHEITDKLSINYGFRYSMFYRMGQQDMNIYANNEAVTFNPELQIYEKGKPIGTEHFGSGKTIASFNNLEPRLAVSYQLDDNQSIKASYNRMSQYIHLVSNTASPTPLDVWAPSDNFIKPQLLDQVALGYFRNFHNDDYTLETEIYYKKVKNRIDYIDGADLIANKAIEQVILNGRSRSYGLEVLLRKNSGKLNGWISYTLSRSEQQTPGRTALETGINNGKWYSTGYDKTHNLAVTASYKLTEKWSFGSTFALQSGQPVTYPNGQYEYGGVIVPSYGARNEDRLPAYHHLDVSATYIPKPDKKKGWQGEWVFSIYNLYNRMNSASMTFRQNEDTGRNEAVRLSIFGFIPSVTYNFKF